MTAPAAFYQNWDNPRPFVLCDTAVTPVHKELVANRLRSIRRRQLRKVPGSTPCTGAMVIGIGQAASSATMGRQGRKA